MDKMKKIIEGIENEYLILKELPSKIKECEKELYGFEEQITHTHNRYLDKNEIDEETYWDELKFNEDEIRKYVEVKNHYKWELREQCLIIMDELKEVLNELENS